MRRWSAADGAGLRSARHPGSWASEGLDIVVVSRCSCVQVFLEITTDMLHRTGTAGFTNGVIAYTLMRSSST